MDAAALALVSATANSLVSLMTSEIWEQAKNGTAALFRRGRRAEDVVSIEDELDASAHELRSALEGGDGDAQGELQQEWRGKLRRLILEHPELTGELQALMNEWNAAQTGRADEAPAIQQSAVARDSGRVYQQGTGIQNNY